MNERPFVIHGDAREALLDFAPGHFDSVVTDPPYALVSIVKRFGADAAAPAKEYAGGLGAYARSSRGFMGQRWDTGETAFDHAFWREVYRVLKPGGHVLAFGGTRTYHRLACAIEDAGFEIRDMVAWLYGSGFPKSHDVSKGIDKAAGAERDVVGQKQAGMGTGKTFGMLQSEGFNSDAPKTVAAPSTAQAKEWQGWGTALKPALEPIVLARKLLIGTVAENVLKHGTGAINVDGCRVGTDGGCAGAGKGPQGAVYGDGLNGSFAPAIPGLGRWPANVIHDGSDEAVEGFPDSESNGCSRVRQTGNVYGAHKATPFEGYVDAGSASRFYYTAKADETDRIGSKHPTVKPVDLMQYLCRLITPPGGVVLDPFAGSGSTGEAAWREGFRAVLIEREADYIADIHRRLELLLTGPEERQRAIIDAKGKLEPVDTLPLFSKREGVM